MGSGRGSLKAWLLIGALAALPTLAGCIGTAQASAMEMRDPAQDLAEDWDSQATLVGVLGLEGGGGLMGFLQEDGWDDWSWDWDGHTSHHAGDGAFHVQSSDDHWARAADDDSIGDGKCEVWAYRFISPSQPGKVYVVVLDRDGELLHDEVDDRESQDEPLGNWEIDSDEAAEIALDVNEGLRRGTNSEHYGIMLALGQDEEYASPTWFIAGGGGDASGGGGGFVVIDAVTGEVRMSQGGFGGPWQT